MIIYFKKFRPQRQWQRSEALAIQLSLAKFGDSVDADIEQRSGDYFGLMEVTVPDELGTFEAIALIVAGEMLAVYGESAAVEYMELTVLDLLDNCCNSLL